MRWCIPFVVGVVLAAEPAAVRGEGTLADAEKASHEGLAAYDQALVEDLLGNGEQVRFRLKEARRWFGKAAAILEERLKSGSDAELTRRLVEVRRAGRPCCGKRSLWDRYPLDPEDDAETAGDRSATSAPRQPARKASTR